MTHKFKQFNIKVGLLLALCLMVFLNTGCDESDPTVSTSVEEMFISNEAANIPITIKSNTSWTASSDAEWLYLSQKSGRGTTDINMMVEALVSDKPRTATVTISAENGNKTSIKVTQNGLTETGIRITPKTITVGPKASLGNTFGVVVQYSDAVVSAVVTSGENWIKNLTPSTDIDGYVKNVLYTFAADEHTDAFAREGKITVTVTFANQVHTEEITVIQNGLGTPTISTQERIYLMHNQTSYAQNMWVEDGDQTNVRYECHVTSSQSGTGNEGPWITSAAVNANGILELTTLVNTYDEVREGEVMVIAFRGAASIKTSIHVIQSGHRSAGANIPNSLLTHDYKAATHQMALNPINDSKLKVVANNSVNNWVKSVTINNDGVMTYALAAYDGSMGSYREATISLEASNGNSNTVYYYITIRQYAPEAAGLSLPTSLMTHNSRAQLGIMPVNANYASTVEVVGVSQTWVTNVRIFASELVYELDAYDGAEGAYREAIITLKATNDHTNAAYYYVTIRQHAPEAAGMNNTVQIITFNSDGTTDKSVYGEQQVALLPLNSINGSTLVYEGVSEDWVTIQGLEVRSTFDNAMNYTLTYGVDQFDGREGDMREAVITIKASNSHVNDAYYYIIIRQYAPLAAGVSEYPSLVEHSHEGNLIPIVTPAYLLTFNALNRSEIEFLRAENVGFGTNWFIEGISNPITGNENDEGEARRYTFRYRLRQYNGADGPYRDVRLVFSATNTHNNASYFYVTIRQYAPEAAGITVSDQVIMITSLEQSGRVDFTTLNGSKLVDKYVRYEQYDEETSYDWLTLNDNVEKGRNDLHSITFNAKAYDGSVGDFREAQIYLVVRNDHADRMLYKVVVRQYAPNAAGISISEQEVHISYQATEVIDDEPQARTISYEILNESKVTSATSSASWLKVIRFADGEIAYTVESFAGGQAGNTREATINLVVENSHANPITYTVKVVQHAPEAAGISIPTTPIVIPTAGTLENGFRIPFTSQNGSRVSGVDKDQITWSPNDYTFISRLFYDNDTEQRLLVYANPFDGSTGDARYVYINVPVSNDHANKVSYMLTLVQYAPNAAGISIDDAPYHVSYQEVEMEEAVYSVPYELLNGSGVEDVKTVSVGGWLEAMDVPTLGSKDPKGTIYFGVKKFTGGQAGDTREGKINISVKNSHSNLITYTITVVQHAPEPAGLSIPTTPLVIPTEGTGPTSATGFWVNFTPQNGSRVDWENIRVTPLGEKGNGSFIYNYYTDNDNKQRISVLANPYNGSTGDARYAYMTVPVKNDHANAVSYVLTFVQYAPGDAKITLANQTMEIPHLAADGNPFKGTVAYTLKSGSSITSITTDATTWITELKPATLPTSASGNIEFTALKYDGSNGATREGIITIKIKNTQGVEEVYSIKVIQKSPEAAGISLASTEVSAPYKGATTDNYTGTVAYTLKNGSSIIDISKNVDWLTDLLPAATESNPISTNGNISFTATKYNGAQGATREGIITITVKNDQANQEVVSIKVTQGAPEAPGIELQQEMIEIPSTAITGGAGVINYTLLNGAGITGIEVTGNGLTIATPSAYPYTGSVINYNITAYDGSAGDYRDALVTLTIKNDYYQEIKRTVTIRQYKPNAAGIDMPPMFVTHALPEDLAKSLPLNVKAGSEVKVLEYTNAGYFALDKTPTVDASNHLTYELTPFAAAAGTFRESVVTLQATNTASGAMANYYVTIRQYAKDNTVGLNSELPAYLGFGSEATSFSLPLDFLEGTTTASAVFTSTAGGNWVTTPAADVLNKKLTFNVTANTTTDTREGYITLTVGNGTKNAVYYINVRQYASGTPIAPANYTITDPEVHTSHLFTKSYSGVIQLNNVTGATVTPSWTDTSLCTKDTGHTASYNSNGGVEVSFTMNNTDDDTHFSTNPHPIGIVTTTVTSGNAIYTFTTKVYLKLTITP
ncbi:hypothetical protein M2480_003053 [Parabacteroides sp. PFB2-12]|uniref:BACON domain-containing protein n=1 Tax=unclassified Parabacteroides TaxID=2649774 RepID=UPI00247409FE|nr:MULTISPECIES: BACON domain-containing carbohydrate-binding protein [unclassified Parabacteroides]MDH6342779.1 hypothetical protein [Parabacteroides sp. PM6-13]MDH6392047.1 hypothetical protein [Parabacteroides sp. PFB2-12]